MNKTNENTAFFFYPALLIFLIIIIKNTYAVEGARNAFLQCLQNVLPTLFPSMVFTTLMTSAGIPKILETLLSPIVYLFGIPSECTPILIFGETSGYPAGIKTAVQLYKSQGIDRDTAADAALKVFNPGISYSILAVGRLIDSGKAGVLLYLSVSSASLAVSLLFRKRSPAKTHKSANEPVRYSTAQLLIASVNTASAACISMCSWITFFGALSGCLDSFDLRSVKMITDTVFEVTKAVTVSIERNSIPRCAFSLGFGGLSVFFQLLPDMDILGVKPLHFLSVRLLNGLFSAGFAKLYFSVFHLAEPSLSTVQTAASALSGSGSCTLSLMFLCFIFMLALANKYNLC